MILADADIEELASEEDMIEPWDPERLQPASYDCTLANTFQVFASHRTTGVDLSEPESYENLADVVEVGPGESFTIHPGEFVLGATVEFFRIPVTITGRIEGKSSLGRLGLLTHVTAGFIDPGFHGNATLEFVNLLRTPITLRPGIPICQMSFSRLTRAAAKPYQGRYMNDTGAVASRYRSDGALPTEEGQ